LASDLEKFSLVNLSGSVFDKSGWIFLYKTSLIVVFVHASQLVTTLAQSIGVVLGDFLLKDKEENSTPTSLQIFLTISIDLSFVSV